MRVIAGGFANAAWRTGLTQDKVGHPGSPSPGFHSSVTVERGPRANPINPSAVISTVERNKTERYELADELVSNCTGVSKSSDYGANVP